MTDLQDSINNLLKTINVNTEKMPVEKQVEKNNKIINREIKTFCRLNKTVLLNDLIINENNKKLIEFLKEYKNHFVENIEKQTEETTKQLNCNLILVGTTGTGKSYIINALINELNQLKKVEYNAVYNSIGEIIDYKKNYKLLNCIRINQYDLIQDLRQEKYNNITIDTDYKNSDLLVIDEFRMDYTKENDYLLYQLIDYRYNYGLPTFVISNLPFVKDKDNCLTIQDVIGKEIRSRLSLENTKKIQLQGNMR